MHWLAKILPLGRLAPAGQDTLALPEMERLGHLLRHGGEDLRRKYETECELKVSGTVSDGDTYFPLPDPFKNTLEQNQFDLADLERKKILEKRDGRYFISLFEFAAQLPLNILAENIECDWRKRAEKCGVPPGEMDALEMVIHKLFKGTIGRDAHHFGILLDAQLIKDNPILEEILCLAQVEVPLAYESVVPGAAPKPEINRWARSMIQREHPELDPDSLVVARLDRTPLACHLLARILNFQGASRFLLPGLQRS